MQPDRPPSRGRFGHLKAETPMNGRLGLRGFFPHVRPLFWYNKAMRKTIQSVIKTPARRFLLTLCLSACILGGVALLRSAYLRFHTTGVFYWKVFYSRGLPLVIAGCLLCAAAVIFILRCQGTRPAKGKLLTVALLCLIGLSAGILIAQTRLGLEKENAFYGKPTVPLLEWHLAAAFLLMLLRFCIVNLRGVSLRQCEKFLPLLIWFAAVLIWTLIPNQHGFFSPAGRAPNYETYPFSDGSFYGHYARAAAAGMGLKGDEIPPRPLYIAFLTFLHLLSDNQYDRIIFLQTLVLGLLPVFVCLCGKELHSVEAGLAAAAFVILRETHAILAAPFGHNVSTTKYFFSDLPTAMVCAAYVWMLIRWSRTSSAKCAFAAGCALGAMTLIRTQSLCLIIVMLFPVIASLKKNVRRALGQTLLSLLAFVLCVLPWLVRSYSITGQFVFDHPMTQTAEMARSYNFDGADLSQLPDENDGAYSNRMAAFISQSLHDHFAEIAHFVTVHFINSEICGFRLFPLRDRLTDFGELFKSREPFWETLDTGGLTIYNLIFLGLIYLVLAWGVAGCRERSGAAGLIPLTVITLFNFSTACGRYSAGRYLIPTDWVMMLYFAAGMADALYTLYARVGGTLPEAEEESGFIPSYQSTAAAILFIAALIPAADKLIPQTFSPDGRESVKEKTGELVMECPAENQMYINALAVYPRYYAAGEGEPESAKQGYGAVDYGRLVFITLAPDSFGTIELRTENVPEYLPDGAEVWFSACQSGATSLAETLITERDGQMLIYKADHR